MKKQSQCNRIMQYMHDFGSISTREAFDDLGVTRLSGRIYDLKKTGCTDCGQYGKEQEPIRRDRDIQAIPD